MKDQDMWDPNEKSGFLVFVTDECDVLGLLHELRIDFHLHSLTPLQELHELVEGMPNGLEYSVHGLSPWQRERVIRNLTNLACHYIHRVRRDGFVTLPSKLARPLWYLCGFAGRSPFLTYATYVLANFEGEIHEKLNPEEIKVGDVPSGTEDEKWFVAVHSSIESSAGPLIDAVKKWNTQSDRVGNSLNLLSCSLGCLNFAIDTMPRVRERLDPEVFRNDVRPLLHGTEGVLFEGVPGTPLVKYVGETGAQSGVIRAIDLLLRVHHSDQMESSIGGFLSCAPLLHQQYFQRLKVIGQDIAESQASDVRVMRRRCLDQLASFRRTHLTVVSDYLAPHGSPLATTGTGGTRFSGWLGQLVADTEAESAKV
jgi:hypothetical protein